MTAAEPRGDTGDERFPPMDERLKRAELRGKLADIALKRSDLRARSGWARYVSSPLAPVVVTVFAGFVLSQITSLVQSSQNIALEKEKLKSSLFLKMIETNNSEASAKNLLFLLDLKLIDDPSGKIAALRTNPAAAPTTGSFGQLVPSNDTDVAKFFGGYNAQFGAMSPDVAANLTQIFAYLARDKSITDIRYVAYILATIRYETGTTFAPTAEICSEHSCDRYSELYKGRGYIQLTFERNYKLVGDLIGVDLVGHPELEMEPGNAYATTSILMIKGLATGRKLSDFIAGEKCDYVGARKIVNGTSQAARVAGDAVKFETILKNSVSRVGAAQP